MKNLLRKISRKEIVVALSGATIAAQAGLDAATSGLDWSTGLRAVATAVVAWAIRSNVYSKATVEG